jgi:uncharacterized protein (TIGR02145 family)
MLDFHSRNLKRVTGPVFTYGRQYNVLAARARSKGRLYNYYAVMDARGLAPVGWHIPTQAEKTTLLTHIGGDNMGYKLREPSFYVSNGGNLVPTNEFGFNVFAAGSLFSTDAFSDLKYTGLWTTYYDGVKAWYMDFQPNTNYTYYTYGNREWGLGVRYIKDDSNDTGFCVENDGYVLPTVKIGTQVWTAENAQTSKYRDGSTVALSTSTTAFLALTTGASIWYNLAPTYSLAPAGYHLPTKDELAQLALDAGGTFVDSNTYNSAGGKLKEPGLIHWSGVNTVLTPESGFKALGAGYRGNAGAFMQLGSLVHFWSATDIMANYSNDMSILNSYTDVTLNGANDYYYSGSVRFVRNKNWNISTPPTDVEGNAYPIVTIGSQTFLQQSWKSLKYRNATVINAQTTYTDAQWAALTTPACCAYQNNESYV